MICQMSNLICQTIQVKGVEKILKQNFVEADHL